MLDLLRTTRGLWHMTGAGMVAADPGHNSNSSEQEDVFFAHHMASDGFRLAPRLAAYDFCLEVPCADMEEVDVPFAVHAAWYYNDERRVMGLLDRALGRWTWGAAQGRDG